MKANRTRTTTTRRAARALPAVLALAATVLLGAAPVRAADAAITPEALVEHVSTDTIEAIRADKAIQGGDFDRLQKLVTERVLPHIDFDRMTRLAVGRAWRGATAEQRKSLIEEFRTLLLHTYSNALTRVSDHKVRLRPSRPQSNPTDAIVRTQVVPSQGDPIDLDYRLELVGGEWKVYDINILGVWLVEAYKNEFNEAVAKGGVDALLATLVEKNHRFTVAAK
jgi:phospholipid transport system substrate-binding protein